VDTPPSPIDAPPVVAAAPPLALGSPVESFEQAQARKITVANPNDAAALIRRRYPSRQIPTR
jgi:hypothetical protein